MKIFFISTIEFSKIALQKLIKLEAQVVGLCTK
jgi:methionyl-tRNA formyltransferase